MLADAHISSMGYLWFNVISQKGGLKLKLLKKNQDLLFVTKVDQKLLKKDFFCCSLPLFIWSDVRICKFYKKSKISKHFCAILRRNQDCKITLSSIKTKKCKSTESKELILMF